MVIVTVSHGTQEAYARGEVPIGCVLVSSNDELLSSGRNRVEEMRDCTEHAEMATLRSAMKRVDAWRLLGTTLYCTVEPCIMCLGAIQLARVQRVVFGTDDHRLGAVHSWVRIPDTKHPFHEVEIHGGLLAEESSALLKSFFRERRKQNVFP